jgi:hypothetical protein
MLPILCSPDEPAVQNGDTNGDGALDVSDAIRLLSWLFSGGREPVAFACGDDAVPVGLGAAEGGTDRPIAWYGTGPFSVDMSGPIVFYGVTEGLRILHLGLASMDFEIVAVPASETTLAVVGGQFVMTAADGELLSGNFLGGAADLITGVYYLDWDFRGGTGRFSDASGAGRTDGLLDPVNGVYYGKNYGTISY